MTLRYQFAAMFSNGFGNIFHKNKSIVFKYIRATLANNYFANQESLPLPRHFLAIDVNSLPSGPLLCGGRREICIPPPTSWVEEWLDIKQKRLINLSAISHHHQTLNEIVFGWWKFQSAKAISLAGVRGKSRMLGLIRLPSGHWLWFCKYFPCDLSLVVPDGHASWQHFDGFSPLALHGALTAPINQSLVKWCFHKNDNTASSPKLRLCRRKMKWKYEISFVFTIH